MVTFSEVSGEMVTSGMTCCTYGGQRWFMSGYIPSTMKTYVGYEFLFDERSNNGTFTNTLWEV